LLPVTDDYYLALHEWCFYWRHSHSSLCIHGRLIHFHSCNYGLVSNFDFSVKLPENCALLVELETYPDHNKSGVRKQFVSL
jgi:hypothetical protein